MKKNMTQQLSDKIRNRYMETEKSNRSSIVLDSQQISNIKKQNSRLKNKTRLYDGPTKSKIRSTSPIQAGGLDLRKRVVHMLAPKPMKLVNLSKMLKIKETEPELINILENISTKNATNEYKLKPDIYKEVELQTWHTWDHNQRNQAIENAKKAFEEINLPPSAPEWNKLNQKKTINISAPVQPVNTNINDTTQRKINPIASEKRATKQFMSQIKNSRNKRANASTAKVAKVKRNDNIPIANHSVQQSQSQTQAIEQKKNIEEMNSSIANHQETSESDVDKKSVVVKRNPLPKSNKDMDRLSNLPRIKKKSLSQMKKQMSESIQNEKEEDINSLSAPPPRKLTVKRKRIDSTTNQNPKSKIPVIQNIEPLIVSEPISTFNEYNNIIEKYNKHQQELQKLDRNMKDISESYNKRRRDLMKFDNTDLLERKLYTEFKEKAQELLLIKNQYNNIYNNLQKVKEKLETAKENLINSI